MPDHHFARRPRLPADAYTNPEHTFHLVARALPETIPFLGQFAHDVWADVTRSADRGQVVLLAACLMPDHVHVIAKPASIGVDRWFAALKSRTTRLAWGAIDRMVIWQPGYYDRRIRDEQEYESTLFYVRRNPAEAGLVADENEWPFLVVDESA